MNTNDWVVDSFFVVEDLTPNQVYLQQDMTISSSSHLFCIAQSLAQTDNPLYQFVRQIVYLKVDLVHVQTSNTPENRK